MPRTRRQAREAENEHAKGSPTRWDCEEENADLPESDHEGGSEHGLDEPRRANKVNELEVGNSRGRNVSEQEDELEEANTQRGYKAQNHANGNWQAYQDRMLIQIVDEIRPFGSQYKNRQGKIWEDIARRLESLSEGSIQGNQRPTRKSGVACKRRFMKLIEFHSVRVMTLNTQVPLLTPWQKGETHAKQATGDVEDVDQHVKVIIVHYPIHYYLTG